MNPYFKLIARLARTLQQLKKENDHGVLDDYIDGYQDVKDTVEQAIKMEYIRISTDLGMTVTDAKKNYNKVIKEAIKNFKEEG